MRRWLWIAGIAAGLGLAVPAAQADLFDSIMHGGSKKKAEPKSTMSPERKFKFAVYLTTGDVLKAVEYRGGGKTKKGSFRFISNFESDIDIKTPFIKYIDMDMIGDQPLEEEYLSSKSDRVYLKNQDYLTGKVVGFTANDVLVTTTYGDLKASIPQIRYVMFRNPVTHSEPAKAPAAVAPVAPAPPPPAPSESEEK